MTLAGIRNGSNQYKTLETTFSNAYKTASSKADADSRQTNHRPTPT